MDVAIPIDSTVTEMGKSHLAWVAFSDGGITSLYPTFSAQAGALRPVVHDASWDAAI